MVVCRCVEAYDVGVSAAEAEDEAAARLASGSIPPVNLPASSSAAVDVVGGVISRRLFVPRKCVQVVCKVVGRE